MPQKKAKKDPKTGTNPDRPTKDAELKIRLAPEDKQAFEAAARSRGLSVSAWLRMLALDALRNAPPRT